METNTSIHCAKLGRKPRFEMLDHLLDYEPPIEAIGALRSPEAADPGTLLNAQHGTSDWLASLGAPTADTADATAAASLAQSAFQAITAPATDAKQRTALLALKTPAAVQHLTGMLTAYDWEFVHQAKELRGYAVSKILEEVEHPDARIRLRALELLGRVTEVALFTDRVEVKKTELKDNELDAKIKEKLARFMGVTDLSPTDAVLIASASHEAS
jgi:hypothetical protein